MPSFKLPLSGDVVQSINPWTALLSPIGSQFGLININLGQSSAPDVEAEVLSDVASYGKQLGQIGDARQALFADDDQVGPDAFEDRPGGVQRLKCRGDLLQPAVAN